MPESSPSPRFDHEAWLRAALDVLARDGQAKVNIEKLAAKLGVTKGSFYHHFKNRGDFMQRLLTYWKETYNDQVIAHLDASSDPADDKLLELMQRIRVEGLGRYDIAFRSWAAQEPWVADVVREVDLDRYEIMRRLFAELGFDGAELEERTRIWLVYHSAEGTVSVPEDGSDSDAAVRLRYRLFTGMEPRSRES